MATTARSVSTKSTRKNHRSATARDVMTADPETTTADVSLFDAASKLAGLGVRHLPVVDDRGCLIGILSDRDVRTAIGDPLEALRGREDLDITVGDAMKEDPVRERMTASITQLATLLSDERIGAIPIVDEGDHPIGIVSYVDLLAHFAKL